MRTMILSLLLGTVATAASAVNFSGKWAMQVPGRGGPMRSTMTMTLILNQVGNEVTGNIASAGSSSAGSPVNTEILDGKVDGDTITFYVWTGSDQPSKRYYKGTMSGEEITFTVTGAPIGMGFGGGQGRGPSGPQQLTAKRTK
jgi:hypothetical protein